MSGSTRINRPYLAARSVVSVSSRVHPLISVHSCQFVVKIFKKGLDAISYFTAKGSFVETTSCSAFASPYLL